MIYLKTKMDTIKTRSGYSHWESKTQELCLRTLDSQSDPWTESIENTTVNKLRVIPVFKEQWERVKNEFSLPQFYFQISKDCLQKIKVVDGISLW